MYNEKTKQILTPLNSFGDASYHKKMAHFGIDNSNAYGVSLPNIRTLAKVLKVVKEKHALAFQL